VSVKSLPVNTHYASPQPIHHRVPPSFPDFYILDLLVQYHQNLTQNSLAPHKMATHASLEQEHPTLRAISEELAKALPRLEQSRRLQKEFPAPSGGISRSF
jgi:hypothetical protein